MSIEAYKIAVKISLLENVTAGLGALSRHFKSTEQDAARLEKRMASIGKMAFVGGGMVAAGAAGFKLLEAPLEKAIDYEKELARLRQQGLGDSQIEEAKKYADSIKIVGQSKLDMIRHFTDAQGAFREAGLSGEKALEAAKIVTPSEARYAAASALLGEDKKGVANQAMVNMNKAVEILGGLNDTSKANSIIDGTFKMVQASGRMIDERQLKQFVAHGASSTNSIDLRTIFGGLEPIIGEYGGYQTATGLNTAFMRMSGATMLFTKRSQALLNDLGIGKLDHGKYRLNDTLLSKEQKDPIAFAKEIEQIYSKHGITNQLDVERSNALLFGRTGAKIYNKIMSQMPTIERSLLAYDKSLTPEQMLNTPEGKRLNSLQDFHKKIEDLQLVLGRSGGVLDLMIKALNVVNPMLEKTANFMEKHGTITKILMGAFMALSTVLVAVGGLLLMMSTFRAVNMALEFTQIASRIGAFGSVLRYAGQIVAFVGRIIVGAIGGPVLAVVGILAVVALLVWNNWAEIKKNLFIAFGDIKNGFTKLFHGDIMGALKLFANVWLLEWQTIFNTLIAGINKILPNMMAIDKLHFADDFRSKYIATPSGQTVQVNTTVNMSGEKVAAIVSKHQAKAASRPSYGTTRFDPTANPMNVGLAYQ